MELLGAVQALQHRMVLEPDFRIQHPGLQRIFEHARKISPILDNDRFTVPEYQELLRFISSGELWDMVLGEMPNAFFQVDVPAEFTQSINTNPF